MLKSLKNILILMSGGVFTSELLAHPGEHGADGFIQALLHQLTAVDHGLLFLVLCLFVGLFISTVRRS